MTGYDFINLAGRLAVLPNADEAVLRTAVSRAYYGAFHVAREFLRELGFVAPRSADAHTFVQRQLMGSGYAEASRAGSRLGDLQTHRNKADYDIEEAKWFTPELPRVSVERAHAVRSALAACDTDAARDEIEQGIRLYQARLKK